MLVDIILQAKAGNEEANLLLIEQFNPLLKKYTYKLRYDDAYNDLLIYFLELIQSMNIHSLHNTCDGSIVSYISKSIYFHYINQSKSAKKYYQTMLPFSQLNEKENYRAEIALASADHYSEFSTLNLDKILTPQELQVVYGIFFLGYSAAEIAQAKNTSRQAINQTKIRALKKLKKVLAV